MTRTGVSSIQTIITPREDLRIKMTTIEYEYVAFDKVWKGEITFDTDDEDELAKLWWEHCKNGIITAVRK